MHATVFWEDVLITLTLNLYVICKCYLYMRAHIKV